MGLMSIFIFTLTEIFLSVLELQTESQQTTSVESDGRFILNRLNYDISRASNITTPGSLGEATSSAVLVVSGVNYTYDGTENDFILINDFGNDQLNSNGTQISNVSFTRLGNLGGKNNLQIKFRLTSTAKRPSGAEIKDFQTTMGLR